jgi:hypothetical protein
MPSPLSLPDSKPLHGDESGESSWKGDVNDATEPEEALTASTQKEDITNTILPRCELCKQRKVSTTLPIRHTYIYP